MISVDKVIAANLPQLENSPKVKGLVKKGLGYLLHEQEFITFGNTYPHLQGLEFVEQVLDELNFDTRYKPKQIEHIPNEGKLVIVANHPIGSLDALALIKVLSTVRQDLKVVANRMLMSVSAMHSLLLPVDNLSGMSKKQELSNIQNHLKGGGALLIFPAGEVSRLGPTGIKDCKWNSGFLRMAKKANCPILPIFIKAKNSPLFYGTSMIYKPLASLLLVTEMFKQRKKSLEFEIGASIPPESYLIENLKDKEIVNLIRKQLYRLTTKKTLPLKTQTPIAVPECRKELKRAIEQCQLLGKTHDGMHIHLYQYVGSSPIFRELGRLREIAFRAVGEGSGKRRDIDKYDMDYQHLVLWDPMQLELVGAYRLACAQQIIQKHGREGLYTDSLFSYTDAMTPYLHQGIELGRSFVQPKYWGRKSLDYLWYGIGAFIKNYPQYRYLFGAVSVSNALPEQAKAMLVYYYQHYYKSSIELATPNNELKLTEQQLTQCNILFNGNDVKEDFVELKHVLANMGAQVPTLFKQYTELCNPGGVQFLSFSIDPDFNNCIDGLVLVDLKSVKENKAKRYLE
ncbi:MULTISPECIES: lysophospholipid acyltransferase family protein [Pseudoalteromonas]|jgi:putative hemolysin|uniref:L-ornithine N(alpha)-acyltransferase n=1 Tax=Pseudoalteromonas distincta TaxID=77608 RepID=F3BF11_9GAMM|nr:MULTISPECIES: lysophospholipid acyltransferase family protein [Pseudoalteromonas]EGI74932.1 acyltransferase family protein [Pseudoalteromonas distincta]KAA1159102.1 lysophospholipid acyltransferase family protein [Pseudoalteromonas distincta]MBB1280652.1 lysophospholipid acyltransferase family protein [Pseudoalteromonas sp. SR41-1]MBB1444447.1 lysophospholipid acyltransferase family protein [Pseudoalteromonas sp. SG43-3]MBB1455019.1 lysophospholipid acyltransferase family protein [Pseudoalt|tara:strand:+ start:29973 stop:31679 length:1707 start_codon:yes stop_codon:yes gene_type:complete